MKCLLLLCVFFVALNCQAGDFNGAMLAQGWDVFAVSELEEPDGIFYFAYVLGVTQGTDANSTLFDHVPGFSMARMGMIVGRYIEKHRNDPGFNERPAVNIVTAAVLAVYPRPEVVGQNM